MVISCVAFGCANRQTSVNKTLSFHRFPHNKPKLFKQWKLAVRRHKWEPSKTSYICSKHFKEEDYIRKKGSGSRSKLKPDAIPSIFDFSKQFKLKKTKPIQTKRVFDKYCPSQNPLNSHPYPFEQYKINVLQAQLTKLRIKYRLLMNINYRQKILICKLNSQVDHLTEEIINIDSSED